MKLLDVEDAQRSVYIVVDPKHGSRSVVISAFNYFSQAKCFQMYAYHDNYKGFLFKKPLLIISLRTSSETGQHVLSLKYKG